MSGPAQRLTARLLRALDTEYNVVDMRAIDEVISELENINITKELLETTRLGKHVNELRRRTGDANLARRTKLLVKRWRDLVIPDKAGSKPATPSAESTPRQSPIAVRGISPAVTPSVTPQLTSPQVPSQALSSTQKQGSFIPSDNVKPIQQNPRRQPLTSPALHNLSPGLRNSSLTVRSNSSPNFKNVVSGQRVNSPVPKTVSPAVRSMSPSAKNSSHHGVKNLSPAPKLISPALRIQSDRVWNVTASKDPYDSDSQDVILIDDVDDTRTTFGSNSNSVFNVEQNNKSSKRPRSPVNGTPEIPLPGEELRRGAKRARRESSGRKAKKRRNHTKSENRTVDHSVDNVSIGSPFLPVSSASTSPALSGCGTMRNGMAVSNSSLIIDDLDSRSPASATDSKSKSSRKNGCKKPSIDVDDYSNFIKNKIPTGGRKVKTTKELLEEMQARKSGKIPITSVLDKKSKPKDDFLTTYDSQKQLKKEAVVTDIIELNDSNSSSKIIESVPQSPVTIKDEIKDEIKTESDVKLEVGDKPEKFEPVDVILSRLPPIDRNMSSFEDDFSPVCTCTIIKSLPDADEKIPSPEMPAARSIFEMDYDENPKKDDGVVIPAFPTYEEKIDPNCQAARVYHDRPAEISNFHIDNLHNNYLCDVNGSKCEKPDKKDSTALACRMSAWGLRPYYDCSRDLFHNVVPKYKYLDFSLDRCVKNLNKVTLDRYEPVEAVSDTSDWYLSLENDHFEKWKVKNEGMKCDDYQSAADSPFSEKGAADQDADDNAIGTHFDSDKKHSDSDNNVNLDRDADLSTHSPAINGEIDSSDNLTDKKVISKNTTGKTARFEILDYEVSAQCRPFGTAYSRHVFLDDVDSIEEPKEEVVEEPQSVVSHVEDEIIDQDPENEEESSEENYASYIPRLVKKFTYEDSITLLPLSLPALNSYVSYDTNEVKGDLSCVFRTKCTDESQRLDDDLSSKEMCEMSYGVVQNAEVFQMKDISNSVINRTRDLFVGDHDEDANCGSDVKKPGLVDESSNSGAFVKDDSEVEKCVSNGCPTWIPGSVPANSFREWYEPVTRTTLNDEPLTILPYVVID